MNLEDKVREYVGRKEFRRKDKSGDPYALFPDDNEITELIDNMTLSEFLQELGFALEDMKE